MDDASWKVALDYLTQWVQDEMDAISQDDIFSSAFSWMKTYEISFNISLNFVPNVQINNIKTLIHIMAWHRPGNKPLSGPMVVSLLTHICVTRPQWVNKTGLWTSLVWDFIKIKIYCKKQLLPSFADYNALGIAIALPFVKTVVCFIPCITLMKCKNTNDMLAQFSRRWDWNIISCITNYEKYILKTDCDNCSHLCSF